MTTVDIVVIGGGPAGAIAAHVIARLGQHSVLVVDREDGLRLKVGESLPAAARPLLKHLDLLSVVENSNHLTSYGNLSAWGSPELNFTDFIVDPNGLGWHLDRARFDRDLKNAAQASGALWRESREASVSREANGWAIQLENETIHARWIIDCSGRSAVVARKFGAARAKDDQLMAVYTWFTATHSDQETRALIESAAHGWWYTARVPENARVVIFHTTPERAGQLAQDPALFANELMETLHVSSALQDGEPLAMPRCSEACGSRLDRFTGDGWTAAGDSAMSFDPLSSQGLFNALYCGMKAGQSVNLHLKGSPVALIDYCDRLEKIRATYISRQQLYYAAETRWKTNSFWEPRFFPQSQPGKTSSRTG